MFAKKVLAKNPNVANLISKESRLTEEEIVRGVADIARTNNAKLVRIVTVGDDKVCDKCAKWQNKIVSLEDKSGRYKTLQEAMKMGFLHYGCRCSLQEISVTEIPRKSFNNSSDIDGLVFNSLYLF
ncbi:hypothetical protein [Fibrobacter sp.]|uniref:hypothetical protein n=1 Tax=Fibrobacter sp. TaxID=35828 RepID=UPI00388E70F0